MNSRTLRSYISLVRALGGTHAEQVTLPGIGTPFPAYRGVPILRNDYNPINQTQGTELAATTIFLVTVGEEEGLAGLMASSMAGINVVNVGPVENKDANRFRVRWYASLALHSDLALAAAYGINN
jgi:hypothetical protein